MIRALDHIVILVHDLAVASADYAALGFTVTPGGEHTGSATHNALVVFADDTYLELIAFLQPAPQHNWWHHVAAGEGLIDFALLPGAIEADIATARERGLPIDGPTAGGRLRPDGQHVAWQTGRTVTPDLPFLCYDVTPRALRVPEGAARQHANGVIGIDSVTVAVTDLDTSVARYRGLLGGEAAMTRAAQTAAFALVTATIKLAAPSGDAGASDPLREQLVSRGEGPFALALRVGDGPVAALDPNLTHGVRLQLTRV